MVLVVSVLRSVSLLMCYMCCVIMGLAACNKSSFVRSFFSYEKVFYRSQAQRKLLTMVSVVKKTMLVFTIVSAKLYIL